MRASSRPTNAELKKDLKTIEEQCDFLNDIVCKLLRKLYNSRISDKSLESGCLREGRKLDMLITSVGKMEQELFSKFDPETIGNLYQPGTISLSLRALCRDAHKQMVAVRGIRKALRQTERGT